MNMELIQPFINSLDAVISETMRCSARIADVTMEEGSYQRTGIAALVILSGDIEGRIILDMDAGGRWPGGFRSFRDRRRRPRMKPSGRSSVS